MKMSSRRRARLIAAVVVFVAIASGCSTTTNGNANPASDTAEPGSTTIKAGPTTSSKSTTTTKPKADAPLADVAACTLLTDADRAQLGFQSTAKDKNLGDRRTCQYSEGDFTASVTIYDNADVASIKAVRQNVRPVPTVGKHTAFHSMFGISCSVTMEIGPTSLVEGSASGKTDALSCDVALKVAQLIEPKLP